MDRPGSGDRRRAGGDPPRDRRHGAGPVAGPGQPAGGVQPPGAARQAAAGGLHHRPLAGRERRLRSRLGAQRSVIAAATFLNQARRRGFDFYTGVPCSFLTPLINQVIGDRAAGYVGAASEGEAVAIAAGAWLAGRGPVVMCQNSGLGNTINPLTSLNWPFRIPVLLITTWRGQPGLKDEPQHELMGRITAILLEAAEVRHRAFPKTEADIGAALDAAGAAMAETG